VTASLLALLLGAAGPVLVAPPDARAGGADAAWVAEAVCEGLSGALAELGVTVVERRERLRVQEQLELPASTLTRASWVRLAEALGAQRLVTGTLELEGGRLQLALRILDVERATLSAPLTAGAPQETLPALLRELAWDVALAGSQPPAGGREEFLARATPGFPALRAYARSLTAADPAAGVRLLREALASAPDYHDAWLALGRLQLDSRDHEAALESLARAQASPRLAREAAFLRGVALLELGRFGAADELLAQLVAERPTAAALNNHALALLRGPTRARRASELLRKAVEADPSLAEPAFNLGWALLCEGDPAGAAHWLGGVVQRDARDTHARLVRVWALRGAGRGAEADAEWAALMARAPGYAGMTEPQTGRRFERIVRFEGREPIAGGSRSDADGAGLER
jgi:tetratricopeptide (TPR) repeat protein